MTATLFPHLDFLLPACAAFGPFFLVMGILLLHSTRHPLHPKLAKAYLVLGGAMIAFCLLQYVPGSR